MEEATVPNLLILQLPMLSNSECLPWKHHGLSETQKGSKTDVFKLMFNQLQKLGSVCMKCMLKINTYQ